MPESKPKFFVSSAEFRKWLAQHHERESELLVGFYKVGSGKPSMTWSESVDEALCFGWIDAVRKSLGAEAYTIRFTRRKPKSIWSAVNVAKVEQLVAQGKMMPAGERAFALRAAERTGVYAFERAEAATLSAAELRDFRRHKQGFAFFEAQAPSYKRTALHWIVSAKKPETRTRRLEALIKDSESGRRLGQFVSPKAEKAPKAPKAKSKPRETRKRA
jgi:uncharacterized protein YdeI (YjbR/CyaY-like superfamily)